ncbi:sporulation protein YabP [Zhaonella formicivorans]|uniref:sporulation protein YabP n=1 Tax=Zhaonella formicivorans TaxID=2528593 RepID=UPI001D111D69|nr:sporulation protein YabP [Zhaonella formicivorans]
MIQEKQHQVKLEDRRQLVITGVVHVDNYDDSEITLQTTLGVLVIKGEDLNISVLNLENGTLNVSGQVNQLAYSDAAGGKKGKGLLQKLLK